MQRKLVAEFEWEVHSKSASTPHENYDGTPVSCSIHPSCSTSLRHLSLHLMGAAEELEYLKSLVTQLNDKIRALETRAKVAVSGSKTPAQQLRTILVGPPGAGE